MSLGIVIANIAGPLRQLPASGNDVPLPDDGPDSIAVESAGAETAASPVISASQPQLTPDFTVVVLQLLNEQGVVTSTIPSAQQLAAYRAGTAIPPG